MQRTQLRKAINTYANSLQSKIDSLKPSGSVVISSCNGITCTAEMSGKGDVIRYVRTFPNGSLTVFHTERLFNA